MVGVPPGGFDPKDPRNVGAVPLLGAIGQQPSGGLMVSMGQPDGSTVAVPIELATLHMLVEIREHLVAIRNAVAGAAEVIDEAEGITHGTDTDAAG